MFKDKEIRIMYLFNLLKAYSFSEPWPCRIICTVQVLIIRACSFSKLSSRICEGVFYLWLYYLVSSHTRRDNL